ncbi:MAG: hypothetical protein A3G23_04120 [Bacteroidetes bacterium RIFCSPLOWO2_12_FULL_37_12]|nr:MAG: hypothetical protein A3G23_04120 [Bacteroidetes bacterium RIFCSPLOWO2_12_FULL_37_12]
MSLFNFFHGKFKYIKVLILTLKVFIIFLLIALGYFLKREEFYTNQIKPLIYKIKYKYKHFNTKTIPLEHLSIEIEDKYLEKTEKDIKNILRDKIILKKYKKKFPALVKYQGISYLAQIKIKGDWFDNVNSSKWSLTIFLDDNKQINGMSQFSIQDPLSQDYLTDWVYQKTMGIYGCINNDINLITVELNNKQKGIYLIHRLFGANWLKEKKLPAGIICQFNDRFLWDELNSRLKFYEKWPKFSALHGYHTIYSSFLEPLDYNLVQSDTLIKKAFENLNTKFYQFLNGDLKPDKLFDLTAMSKYLAISEVLGSAHNYKGWKDRKFFYNLSTGLLEPIAYDAAAVWSIKEIGLTFENLENKIIEGTPLLNPFYYDSTFMSKYLIEMYRLANGFFIDSIFFKIKDSLQGYSKALNTEFSEDVMYSPFYYDSLLNSNVDYIKAILNPSKCLNVFIKKTGIDSITVGVLNIQSLPVYALGFSVNNNFFMKDKLFIPGMSPFEPLKYHYLSFKLNKPAHPDELKLLYSIVGSAQIMSSKILPWSYPDTSLHVLKTNTSNAVNLIKSDKYSGFFDVTNQDITFHSDTIIFRDKIFIPPGYKVFSNPGTNFIFVDSAAVTSFSPFIFKGEEDNPITISPKGNGNAHRIQLVTGRQKNLFKYVLFSGNQNDTITSEESFISLEGSLAYFISCLFDTSKTLQIRTARSKVIVRNSSFFSFSPYTTMKFYFSEISFDKCYLQYPFNTMVFNFKSLVENY